MFKGKPVSGGDYESCPAGNHPGVCIGLIDLGTHWESFQGGPEKKQRKVLFVWEVDVGEEGKVDRKVIGRDFNLTMREDGTVAYGNKSNIRKLLEGWRGKEYGPDEDIDPEAVVGKGCLVSVKSKITANKKEISVVDSVSALPKGMKPFKPENPIVKYSADSEDGAPDQKWLPRVFGEEIHKILERSLEWNGTGRRNGSAPAQEPVGAVAGSGQNGGSPPEDEVPF